jgi:hypothetical protein
MNRPLLLIICLIACACAAARPFTKQDAAKIARAELAQHGYTIPETWYIVVVPGNVDIEFQRSYPIYIVRFQRSRSERSTVFEVNVNHATRKAEDFVDHRTGIATHLTNR